MLKRDRLKPISVVNPLNVVEEIYVLSFHATFGLGNLRSAFGDHFAALVVLVQGIANFNGQNKK